MCGAWPPAPGRQRTVETVPAILAAGVEAIFQASDEEGVLYGTLPSFGD